jgi:lycopene cyclase domain-containing protein
MPHRPASVSPLASFRLVLAIVGMIALPAALTFDRIQVSAAVDPSIANPSPYGYTVSLLLFIVPIAVIGLWLVPKEDIKISKTSFLWTIGILFPLGAALDFFFARIFFTYSNPGATLRITAPALGGGVPVEEYIFYFTGFVAVLLTYLWLDEYWLAAYRVPVDSAERTEFARLVRFHPQSLIWAVVLIAAAILYRSAFVKTPGFPGYFSALVVGALGPSAALLPSALPVINWRAFSLTAIIILLISLLWEATLGVPYGWWGFQDAQMIGIRITAWSRLPIEEIFVWLGVTYATAIVYEIVRRWKSSGKRAKHAFFGSGS